MRRDFIEADTPVPLHVLLGVDLQLFVGIHRHQHGANVGLENTTKGREVTGGLEAELRCPRRMENHPGVLGMMLRAFKQAQGAEDTELSALGE